MRDDFSDVVKRTVGARVGYECSNPSCRAHTTGPQVNPTMALNLGVAAHITAASEGGPRYDRAITSDQRRDAANAIWLCQNCAKLVDNDATRFPASLLRRWKHEAERIAFSRIGKNAGPLGSSDPSFTPEEVDLLVAGADRGELIVLSSEQTGKWVAVGANDYLDEADPAFARSYIDALRALCRRGLAEHDEGNLFLLTAQGFRVARALKDSAEAFESASQD
jgi:hypothetical protein